MSHLIAEVRQSTFNGFDLSKIIGQMTSTATVN